MSKNHLITGYFRRSVLTLFTVLTALILVGLSGASAFAATGTPNGFTISPVLSELTINKGQSSTITVYLQNPTSLPLQAEAIVDNFEASTDESGTPSIILKPNAPQPVNNFRSLVSPIPDVTIGPNQQVSVNVTISVPSNADSGGYYGAIRFSPIITGQKQSTIGLTASVGTLVLVTVPGNLYEKLNLVQLSASENGATGSFFVGGNPITIVTRLQNEGNIYFAPFGKIQVTNMFGKVVQTYPFNSPKGNILPNSIRRYSHTLPNTSWLGRYKVQAFIGYGTSGQLLVGSSTFWYIPVWFMIVSILVIIVIVGLIYWASRSISKRRVRKPSRR